MTLGLEVRPEAEMREDRPDLRRHRFANAQLLTASRIGEAYPEFWCKGGERDRSGATGRPRAGDEDVKIRQGLAGFHRVE
jgi:hypothetical protein